jgi:hypothetical protein
MTIPDAPRRRRERKRPREALVALEEQAIAGTCVLAAHRVAHAAGDPRGAEQDAQRTTGVAAEIHPALPATGDHGE